MIKIVYDQKGCIGAGECEVFGPKYWKLDNKGKAVLKDAVLNTSGKYELVVEDSEEKLQKQICGSCPAGCIKVEKA